MADSNLTQSIQNIIEEFKKNLSEEFDKSFSEKQLQKDLKFIQSDISKLKRDFFNSINKEIRELQKNNYTSSETLLRKILDLSFKNRLNEIKQQSDSFKTLLEKQQTQFEEKQKEDVEVISKEIKKELSADDSMMNLLLISSTKNILKIKQSVETLRDNKDLIVSQKFKPTPLPKYNHEKTNEIIKDIKESLNVVKSKLEKFEDKVDKAPQPIVKETKPSVIVDKDKQKSEQIDEESESIQKKSEIADDDIKEESIRSDDALTELNADLKDSEDKAGETFDSSGIWSWVSDLAVSALKNSTILLSAGAMKIYDFFTKTDEDDLKEVNQAEKENDKSIATQTKEFDSESSDVGDISSIEEVKEPEEEKEEEPKEIEVKEPEEEKEEEPKEISIKEPEEEKEETSTPSTERNELPGGKSTPSKSSSSGKDVQTIASEKASSLENKTNEITKVDSSLPDIKTDKPEEVKPEVKPLIQTKVTDKPTEKVKQETIKEVKVEKNKVVKQEEPIKESQQIVKTPNIPSIKVDEKDSVKENIKSYQAVKQKESELNLKTINTRDEVKIKKLADVDSKINKIATKTEERDIIKAQEDRKKYEMMKTQMLRRQSKEMVIHTNNYNMNQLDQIMSVLSTTIKETSEALTGDVLKEERIPTRES